jgi:hypothetical protein
MTGVHSPGSALTKNTTDTILPIRNSSPRNGETVDTLEKSFDRARYKHFSSSHPVITGLWYGIKAYDTTDFFYTVKSRLFFVRVVFNRNLTYETDKYTGPQLKHLVSVSP